MTQFTVLWQWPCFQGVTSMHRFMATAGLALAICALFGASTASAQVVQVYYPAPAPVVSYYAAPPVYVAPAPTVTYYQPAPTVTYYQPAPTVTYYQPVTTAYYAAPAVAYSPGVVTTRSYVGLGIFRPRGVYTQSYYSPAYTSSYYYAPRYYR
jgi:hypothetical protein